MDRFKEEIINILKKETKLKEINLEVPPNKDFGDYAFPCFALAKEFKKNPVEIANELASRIKISGIIKRIEAKGPYLNFFIDKEDLTESTLKKIYKEKNNYGKLNINKKALIEHTSINPNASPHLGRARNAFIGDSIVRLLRFAGYKLEVHYFVNDVGKQIAMLVLGAGNKKPKFNDLLKFYVDINKKIEKNKKLEKDVFDLLYKLEKGDKKIKKQFRSIVDICIKGQNSILAELGIKYDYFDYESKYLWSKETDKILKKLMGTKKLFKDEERRYVLDQKGFNLAMKSAVLVLTRADGTSLYPLRDMAYTIEKMKKTPYNFVVLGEDQKLYFEQLRAALSLLKIDAPKEIHYSFVLLKTGKMSTRKGEVVLLEEFMKEAREKAKEEILKRNKSIKKAELEKLSRIIGYGAVKYSFLKISPEKNVVFDWDTALSFEGETAPYIQYAHARVCSILRKYGKKIDDNINFSFLTEKEETGLIKLLAEFPEKISESLKFMKTNLIANYAHELAKKFNEFYHARQVLNEEEEFKKARLLLIYCVKQVLETSLNLLGIESPERM